MSSKQEVLLLELEEKVKDVEVKGYIKLTQRKDGAKMHFARSVLPSSVDLDQLDENPNERRILDVTLKLLILQKIELHEADFVEFSETDKASDEDSTSCILINDSIQSLERYDSFFAANRKFIHPDYPTDYWQISDVQGINMWFDIKRMGVTQVGGRYFCGEYFLSIDMLVMAQNYENQLMHAFYLLCQRPDATSFLGCTERLVTDDGKYVLSPIVPNDFKPQGTWDHLMTLICNQHFGLFVQCIPSIDTEIQLAEFTQDEINNMTINKLQANRFIRMQDKYKDTPWEGVDVKSGLEEETMLFFAETELPCGEYCRKVQRDRIERSGAMGLTGLFRPLIDITLAYLC